MTMTQYKAKRDSCRQKIASKYDILGFISSGTYGRVYKAKSKSKYVRRRERSPQSDLVCGWFQSLDNSNSAQKRPHLYLDRRKYRDDGKEYAIKKFKPDKEGEAATYIGISQSACREIAVSYGSSYLLSDAILRLTASCIPPFNAIALPRIASRKHCRTHGSFAGRQVDPHGV